MRHALITVLCVKTVQCIMSVTKAFRSNKVSGVVMKTVSQRGVLCCKHVTVLSSHSSPCTECIAATTAVAQGASSSKASSYWAKH